MPVYVIRHGDGDFYKIGYAVNPRTRLSELQVGNPVELRLVAVIEGGEAQETALHERFAAQRHRGEWFRGTPELDALIADNSAPLLRDRSEHALGRYLDQHGLTCSQLAARIGRSPSTITRILRGETLPSWTTIELIEKATDGAVGPNDYRRRAA